MYYIGVDLGTSAVKLILMDKEGNVVKTENIRFIFLSRAGQNRIRQTGMKMQLRE